MSNITQAIEDLASEIGDKVYMDIAKWHLYLENAKLHLVLAERFYPMLAENRLDEDQVIQVLQSIPIKLGGGRREVPLLDLLPKQCQVELLEILEEFQKQI